MGLVLLSSVGLRFVESSVLVKPSVASAPLTGEWSGAGRQRMVNRLRLATEQGKVIADSSQRIAELKSGAQHESQDTHTAFFLVYGE